MNDQYKYWLIYIKSTDINIDLELYAYTDKKSYMKQFKMERNMNKFVIIEKNLSKEEVHRLTVDYNTLYLLQLKGRTRLNSKNYIGNFSIVVTKEERLNVVNVCSDVILSKIWATIEYRPNIFKKKYQTALLLMGYTDAYKYLSLDFCSNSRFEDIAAEFEPDYLNTFLSIYSDLMV